MHRDPKDPCRNPGFGEESLGYHLQNLLNYIGFLSVVLEKRWIWRGISRISLTKPIKLHRDPNDIPCQTMDLESNL